MIEMSSNVQRKYAALRLSPGRHWLPVCSLLIGSAIGVPAYAMEGDTRQPYVSYAYFHDDNLLRVPAAQMAAAPDQQYSDNYRRAEGGIMFDKYVSRQHFTGNVDMNRTSFSRFTELDNNGKDLLVNWKWQLGNDFDGNLGSSYSQSLTPFTEFHSEQLNIRVQRHQFFDGGWRVLPSWRVRTMLSHDSLNYDLTSQSALDYVSNTTEVGLDYLAQTNSTIGIQARRTRGSYPNPQSLGPFVVDNSYTQNEYMCKVDWQATGKTRLQMLAGWGERKHEVFPDRDARGPSARIIVDWLPTGKTSATLTAWRDFSAIDGLTANYSLNKGISLKPVWSVTGKVSVDSFLKYEKHDYSGTAMFPGLLPAGQINTTRYASLSLTYKPIQNLDIGLTVYRDQQTSSSAGGDYLAKGVIVNLRAQF